MRSFLLATAMLAVVMAPAAIAYAGYPDNNKPVAQSNGNANGSGGIPSQLYAYTCTETCYYNTCTMTCY